MNQQKKEKKIWHTQQEKILKVWGEQSSCYRYMHFKSYQKYQKSSMRFTLPIIIISTITGTANFAQDTFPVAWRPYVPSGIGAFNLVAAIMTTILQFLKINELMESHRVSSVHYGKLSRSIRLQLTLPRAERAHDGSDFIEYCNQEYDRLIEQSPPISGKIIKLFEKEFPIYKKKKKDEPQKRTFCLDFKNYCCSSFKEDVDEKELPLERPEIIKLVPIKPYGFHDGTTRSDASQTTLMETNTDIKRPRFKSHPPPPPTPILTPLNDGDSPVVGNVSQPHIEELMAKFNNKSSTGPAAAAAISAVVEMEMTPLQNRNVELEEVVVDEVIDNLKEELNKDEDIPSFNDIKNSFEAKGNV